MIINEYITYNAILNSGGVFMIFLFFIFMVGISIFIKFFICLLKKKKKKKKVVFSVENYEGGSEISLNP